MAIALGHDQEFGKGAVELSWTSEKAQMAAGMSSSGQALIAPSAGDGRLYGHPVSRLDPPDTGAHGLDDGRAFVAQADGITEFEVAYTRLREVVDVAAADAHKCRPQKDIVSVPDLREAGIADLDPARGR
jgi:hypothetical protein